MKLVPLATEALPLMPSWSEFYSLFQSDAETDGRFLHAPELIIDQMPGGMTRGVNLFGPGSIPIMELKNGQNKMRRIESFILANATIIPQSMTIIDAQDRLVMASTENISDKKSIAKYDRCYEIDENGDMNLSDQFYESRQFSFGTALPLCGPGIYNYGHFIYDGLAGALMHHQLLNGRAKLVGPPLRKWQAEILEALGVYRHYVPISVPTQFNKIVSTTMLSMHVSYPSRFVRPLFDQIRFHFGMEPSRANAKIFLSRGTDTKKRVLTNRAEVEELMTHLGFEVVSPDLLSFREQVTLMASARIVVGEAGAGMANIGFCDPGAKIMEILTMADAWTRGACFLMSHRWHGFFPEIAPKSDEPGKAGGGNGALNYSIDCESLAEAIAAMIAS